MEGDGTELTLEKERLTEKACLVSTPHPVSVLKPGKIDECGSNQANQQVTLSPITVTKDSTQESHTSSDVKVTLENEAVWSRFHSLGTEMILTKQGRRMFPCCRFKLSGLDLQRKYFLIMDFMPLDDFVHKWNGKTWEPVAVDVPHVLRQISVHPDSPALGQQWMDSSVSFYKVKLTSESTDQEDCVVLRPMHRYQPRLHIVPVDPDSERTIALDSPNVKMFSFPQTEFYAVTSYQNTQITQLKIDCNPFAMAFRENSQNNHLLQNKLRLSSSLGTRFQSSLLSFAQNLGKRKEGAVKSTVSTSIQDNRVKGPGSGYLKEGEGIFAKLRNATVSCPNDMDLCQENSESDRGNKAVVNKCPAEPVLYEHVAPLDFEPTVTVSLDKCLPITDETVPPISSTENLKSSEDAVKSEVNCTNCESPTKSSMAAQSQGEIKSAAVSLPRPPFLNGSQVHEHKPGRLLRRRYCYRGRKAKLKWWSNVKHTRPHPAVVPLNVPVQPELEDVEGMLFVSFVTKEALNIPAEDIKESETSLYPPSLTHDHSDHHEAEDIRLSVVERIAKFENILLLHLRQLKHRQVIHPRLQDVGMKLSLLDPKLPIDLQYLGVHLPPPSAIHEGLGKMNPVSMSSSPDAAEVFVSRTGKTNDPTKIKGWRDKFKTNAGQSAPEGLKNSSAFCSEMLDAYLENEAQQISDRVAVFSKCSASPVSYRLPLKSSSYVVTLDSLLKTRSTASNKVYSKPMDKILPKSPLRRSPSSAVPLSSAQFQHGFQEKQEKGEKPAHSFQAHQNALSSVQDSRSMSFVSSPGMKTQPGKSQLRWNNSAGTASRSSVCSPMIPVKVKNQVMLQEMEEEAVFHGKVRTHITTKRAKFALTSLLNFKKPAKRPRFHVDHKDENSCAEDFCRLGCMCDSLDREIRGPTHCRRVECMFDCNCFKHKVLLLHPPKETPNVQRGRKRSVLAFPIADPERQPRPPPAPSITTLWKRTAEEHDPEPLFIPIPPISSKPVSRSCTNLAHSTSQVQEEDKDPVYLYFESMMTCARVREYNSNPPPQIHMFPTKKEMKVLQELKENAEAGEPSSSQQISETNPTETPIKPSEPKPTKLLEILSECNWEPHRSLVLSALFRRMNSNLLSEPFCFGMYKIQLLSTTIKGGHRSSTITYKVCVSRADEKMTEDLQPPVKNAMRNQSLNGFETEKVLKSNETQAQKAKAATHSMQKSSTLVGKQQKKPLCRRLLKGLPFTHAAVGYLKADKKKPGNPPQGLIKVNGKSYTQAKVLLGQLGALHPVNRFAAFVTGRLVPVLRDQPKIEGDHAKAYPPKAPLEQSSVTKEANASSQTNSNLAVARPPLASAPEPNIASKNRKSNSSPLNALSNLAGLPPGRAPFVPDGSRFVLVPIIPFNSAAAPSAETSTSSTLPPGQQVVLQPALGMPGSNYLCQYNGQMIQLKPINPEPLVQPQPSSVSEGSTSQVMQTAYNTFLPEDTRSLQKPVNPVPLTETLPKVLSLSAKSGMNIANGMPAFNLQSSFPGKTGTFSFRICPPTGEGQPVRSEHGGKPPEPFLDSSSTLILPGGFTLIKLFHPAVTSVPAVPPNVTSAASHHAEIPQNDESMKKSSLQSCSPSLEQNCQVSESITNPLLPETSDCDSEQGATAGLSQSSDDFPSECVIKDKPVKHVNTVTPDKYDWIPEGAEMVHTSDASDVSEPEPMDLDDWPPNGAERILWIDSGDDEENEELDKNLDVAADSPAAEEVGESKTSTTGTVKADISSCDECLYADKLYFNEKETIKHSTTNENGLPPEEDACSESFHASEHLRSSIPNNDQEKTCDPYVNAAYSSSANISEQVLPFSAPINSPNIREQFMIQERCPPVLIKNVPYNESTHTDMIGNEPNLKNQDFLPENSILHVSKIESYNSQTGENALRDHFHIREQRLGFTNNYGVSIKTESCSASPKADTCSVHDDVTKQLIGSENILPLINKVEPTMNQTVTEISSDLNTQCPGAENSSQILNHREFYNNPTKPNTTASLHAEDSHENIDIAVNAPCSLVDGQTPVMNSPPTEHLLNTASLGQKTGMKKVSPFPHNMHKSSPEISDDFANLSGTSTKTSKINKQDLKEGKDEAEDGNKLLLSETAVGEPCGEEEISAAVLNLSENEDEDQSDKFDRDEGNSSVDGEGDSDSDEEDSSDYSTSDSEPTNDTADISNEDDIDIESFEENDGKRIMIKNKSKHKKNGKRAAKLGKKLKHLSSIISTAGYLPVHELEKRQSHTEKERVRREEMRQSFAALKKALNVEERVIMCRHDILNQARIMIRALEDRSQCLEEKKKALFQRQTAYLSKIVELSEKTEARDRASFGSQNTLQTSESSPQVNPRWLDSDGNRLPPRLRCKAPNYIRKRSRKALWQPSVTTTVSADERLESHLSPDTPINHTVSGPLPLVSTEKRSLPKIVLQSFGKTDTIKLTHDVRTSLPSSTEVSNSAELLLDGNLDMHGQNKGMEKCTAASVCDEMEKTLVSEHSNKESQTPSTAATESDVQNDTLSKLEKDKQASAAVEKVRKKRIKSDVVVEEALSNPDILGPRQLRQRSPAVNGGATRGGTANKRRRII